MTFSSWFLVTVIASALGGFTPAAPEPMALSSAGAVRLAIPAANAALDRAYAAFAKKPGMVAPAHARPWVTDENATVATKAPGGFRVTWRSFPPAGFEFECEVSVSATKQVTVTKAVATFSPD